MRRFTPAFVARSLMTAGLAALLTACGGGANDFKPAITAVKPQSLRYSQTATVQIGGQHLRNSIVADTGGACTNPSYGSGSTTELLVLNCTVERVGDMLLTLRSASGEVLHQTILSVPKPQVVVVTDAGNLTMELEAAAAPASVRNFLGYVGRNYYSGTLFHRVIAGFVVQGGGYTTGMVQKPGQVAPIALESQNGLTNARGTLAMARTSVPDSATSEFFINLVDNTSLNYQSAASPGYAVFGRVISGMEVVDGIATRATGTVNGFNDVPLVDVSMTLVLQVR